MDVKPLTNHRFVLTPRPSKHLSNYVQDVLWNAVSKTLHVQIWETPRLEVYEWMQYIKKQQVEIQKGPFVDLNQDALTLQFLDQKGNEVACLKFKNISLADHSCYLQYKSCPDEQCLTHLLMLGYQEVEMTRREEEDAVPFAANEVADEEWQRR